MRSQPILPLLNRTGFVAVAIFLVLLTAVLIHWWNIGNDSRFESHRRLALSSAAEKIPAKPITLSGDVAIAELRIVPDWEAGRDQQGSHRFGCAQLCTTLLETQGIKSVTVFPMKSDQRTIDSKNQAARTFSLKEKGQCSGPVVVPKNIVNRDAWVLRLSNTTCIQAQAPLEKFDFSIIESNYDEFGDDSFVSIDAWRWTYDPLSVRVYRVDILDRTNRTLMAWIDAATPALSQPLMPTLFAKAQLDFVGGWSRIIIRNHPRRGEEAYSLAPIVYRHTNLTAPSKNSDIGAELTEALNVALSDKRRRADDPIFVLTQTWLSNQRTRPLTSSDEELLIKMVGDDRATQFVGIDSVSPKIAQNRALFDLTIRQRWARGKTAEEPMRILSRQLAAEKPLDANYDYALDRKILSNIENRRISPVLIGRLSDQGTAAASYIMQLIEEHVQQFNSADANLIDDPRAIIEAGATLCRVGSDAGAVLPKIVSMTESSEIPPAITGKMGWQFMLHRLGHPGHKLSVPYTYKGSISDFRKEIADKTRNYRPHFDCVMN